MPFPQISSVPPEIMAQIQAAYAQGRGWSGVDPTTGLEWQSNVSQWNPDAGSPEAGGYGYNDPAQLQQIIAGDPAHFTNGDQFMSFDTKSGAYTGTSTFEKDSGFGSFLLPALAVAGIAMGAGPLLSGLGAGGEAAAAATALPGGAGMDVSGFLDLAGGGGGDFALAGSDAAFAQGLSDLTPGLAGSDAAFNTALSDSGGILQSLGLGGGNPLSTGSRLLSLLTGGGGGGGVGGGGILNGLLQYLNSQKSSRTAQDFANQIMQRSDPFAPNRGRYADALKAMEDKGFQDKHPDLVLPDPNDITKIPGYQAGLEAVQRAGAAQGFTGSGNMMKALQDYGGNFYNAERDFALQKYGTEMNTFRGDFSMYEQELQRLAGLAGGNQTPGAGMLPAAMLVGGGQASGAFGQQALLNSIMQSLGGGGGIIPRLLGPQGMGGAYTAGGDGSTGDPLAGLSLPSGNYNVTPGTQTSIDPNANPSVMY